MFIHNFFANKYDSYVLKARLRGSQGPVNCVAFNTNATLLASGGDDETVRIWDMGKHVCQQSIEDHCGRWGQITNIKWFPVGSDSNEVLIFGTGRGLVLVYRRSKTVTAFHELSNNAIFAINDPVESIAVNPVNLQLAVSSHSGKVKLCSVHKDGTMSTLWIKDFNDMSGPAIPRAIHFHDNYRRILIFFLETGEIRCHLTDSGGEDWQKVLKSPIGNAAFCERSKLFVVDNMKNGFDAYQISKSSPTRHFEVPTASKHLYVKGASLAEDGALALCGSDNGQLHLHCLKSSEKVQTLYPGSRTARIQAIDAISCPDVKYIASSSSDKWPVIHVWKKEVKAKAKANGQSSPQTQNSLMKPSFMSILNFLAILFLFWLTADVWKGYVLDATRGVVAKIHASLNEPQQQSLHVDVPKEENEIATEYDKSEQRPGWRVLPFGA